MTRKWLIDRYYEDPFSGERGEGDVTARERARLRGAAQHTAANALLPDPCSEAVQAVLEQLRVEVEGLPEPEVDCFLVRSIVFRSEVLAAIEKARG